MARFRIEIVVFLLLQAVIAFLHVWFAPSRDSGLMKSFVDKRAMVQDTPAPRLLVAGGSSAAFGVDAALLRHGLRLEPVNLAVSGALGYELILRDLYEAVRPGDVAVVVMAELMFPVKLGSPYVGDLLTPLDSRVAAVVRPWSDWHSLGDFGLRTLHRVARFNLLLWQNMFLGVHPGKVAVELRSVSPHYAARHPLCHRCTGGPSYTRFSFDGYGSHVAHWGTNSPRLVWPINSLPGEDELAMRQVLIIEALNELERHFRRSDASLFVAFPPIAASLAATAGGRVEQMEAALRSDGEFTLLGNQSESIYPDSLFFDSPFHLNGEGVRRYTNHLARSLEPLLPPGPDAEGLSCPPDPVTIRSAWPAGWFAHSATICVYAPCLESPAELIVHCGTPAHRPPMRVELRAEDATVASVVCPPGAKGEQRLSLPIERTSGERFVHFEVAADQIFPASELVPRGRATDLLSARLELVQ